MGFTLDDERKVAERTCGRCGRQYLKVSGTVRRHGDPYVPYVAALHLHEGMYEAWIDVTYGLFEPADGTEHLTLGCRVGPLDGLEHPASSAVDAAAPYWSPARWGRKLSREEALAHPLIEEFWTVTDTVLAQDPVVNHHVYHHHPAHHVTEHTFGRRLAAWSRSRRRRRS